MLRVNKYTITLMLFVIICMAFYSNYRGHNDSSFQYDNYEFGTELECDLWVDPSYSQLEYASSRILLFVPKIIKINGIIVIREDLLKNYKYYVVTGLGEYYALDVCATPDLNIECNIIGVRLFPNIAKFKDYEMEYPIKLPVNNCGVAAVLYDVSISDIPKPKNFFNYDETTESTPSPTSTTSPAD